MEPWKESRTEFLKNILELTGIRKQNPERILEKYMKETVSEFREESLKDIPSSNSEAIPGETLRVYRKESVKESRGEIPKEQNS